MYVYVCMCVSILIHVSSYFEQGGGRRERVESHNMGTMLVGYDFLVNSASMFEGAHRRRRFDNYQSPQMFGVLQRVPVKMGKSLIVHHVAGTSAEIARLMLQGRERLVLKHCVGIFARQNLEGCTCRHRSRPYMQPT